MQTAQINPVNCSISLASTEKGVDISKNFADKNDIIVNTNDHKIK